MTDVYLIRNKVTGEVSFHNKKVAELRKSPITDIYPYNSQEAIDIIGQSLGSKAPKPLPKGVMMMIELDMARGALIEISDVIDKGNTVSCSRKLTPEDAEKIWSICTKTLDKIGWWEG